jgi:hypothetical protein
MNELRAGKEDARAKGKLYLAFELGNKAWKLGFTVGLGQKPRRREVKAGDLAGLQKEIKLKVERRAKRAKTDRLDLAELLSMLTRLVGAARFAPGFPLKEPSRRWGSSPGGWSVAPGRTQYWVSGPANQHRIEGCSEHILLNANNAASGLKGT